MSDAPFTAYLDLDDLPKKMDAVARDMTRQPTTQTGNYHATALRRMQNWMRRVRTPKVSEAGRWLGNLWPRHKDQYTRKTDGAVVPAWGGTKKLSGRGNVKGRLVGGTKGVRLKASSPQMRDTGALLQGWFTAPAQFAARGMGAWIQAGQEYAHKVGELRNWYWSPEIKRYLEKALLIDAQRFYQAVLDRRLKRGRA